MKWRPCRCLFLVSFATISIVGVNSIDLPESLDECNTKVPAHEAWHHIKDIATVAGSYIPRDTFWKRPQYSLAPCFRVEERLQASAGCLSTVPMKLEEVCAATLLKRAGDFPEDFPINVKLNPLFYVRLVGPAIILGTVSREAYNAFNVQFTAHRAGLYMLDIVVEYSFVSNKSDPSFFMQEAPYEGVAIPGSPFEVLVAPNSAQSSPQQACRGAELGSAPGHWLLVTSPATETTAIDFLDSKFIWQPVACRMPDLECLVAASKRSEGSCLPLGQKAMVYTIGDSVMGFQAQYLANTLGGESIYGQEQSYKNGTNSTIFEIHFQATNDGMVVRMASIKKAIDILIDCQLSGMCTPILLFNSGLHEIHFCGPHPHLTSPQQAEGLGNTLDCANNYVQLLEEIVEYVDGSGFAGIKVFRTTTAAWLKFGNSGVNWFDTDKRKEQPFLRHWLPVAKLNEAALPIFQRAGWRVIDGFQSSVGRPDHTEKHSTGALVHFDHEIPDIHNHQLLSMVFESMCPAIFKACTAVRHTQVV